MTQDIRDFLNDSCDLLALGEPTHKEPAFARIRNELFAQLVERGFRSIALETDRVAALAANDFVQEGVGTLDSAMREGFTHGFGAFGANRELIAWMREYNEKRAPEDRLAFYGMDGPFEFTAASPRSYLEHARDYLGLELDIVSLTGDDNRWDTNEAVMDPAASPGDTAEAARLRMLADDMFGRLYADAPDLIAATSLDAWHRAKAHVTSALGLLRYHRQAAQRIENSDRWSRLGGTRDALMAQNLLDIRDIEARRGPTMVHGANVHLQRNRSHMSMAGMDLTWHGTGAIIASLLGDRYTCIVGSLGGSKGIALREPEPGTYESSLQRRSASWSLTATGAVASGLARTDATPEQGYFPLDQSTLDGVDAVLHVNEGTATAGSNR